MNLQARRADARRAAGWMDAAGARLTSRWGMLALFGAALAVYAVEYVAWTLEAGRDLTIYLQYFTDLPYHPAALPNLMTNSQPLPSVMFGLLLEHLGAAPTAAVLGLMYAVSVVCYTLVASFFGKRVALVMFVLLLVYPPFASLYHDVSTDSLFAFIMAVWALCLAHTFRRSTPWLFVANAVLLTALVWTRVDAEAFAVVALAPLFVVRFPLLRRFAFGLALAGGCAVAVGSLVIFNGLAFGQYTTARTANATNPLYLVFSFEHLVRPSNGPASKQLAAAVSADLLNRQPYRAYGITVHEFFTADSPRFWSDLVPLSDRVWGWNSNYAKLRAVGIEAIEAHPATFARSVARTMVDYFSVPYYRGQTQVDGPAVKSGAMPTVTIRGRRLPEPTEGQPIPAANLDWELSTPDQSIWTDWSSIEHPVLRFKRAQVGREYDEMTRRTARLLAKLGTHRGSAWLARALNRIEHLFPPLWLWLLVGLIGSIVRRPRHLVTAWTLVALGLAVVVVAALVQPWTPQYRIPFDPAFILVGVVGLLGTRARPVHGSAAEADASLPGLES